MNEVEADPIILAMVAKRLLEAGIPVKIEEKDGGVRLSVPDEYLSEADNIIDKAKIELVSTDINISCDDPVRLVEEFNKRICHTYVPEDEKEYEVLSGGGEYGECDYAFKLWETGIEMAIAMGMDPKNAMKERVRAARKVGEEVRKRKIKVRDLEIEY